MAFLLERGIAVRQGGCGAGESAVRVVTNRSPEFADGETSMTVANDLAVRRALEAAGVEFIDENGGGPGMRLRWNRQEHRTPPGA
jgi:hypothetical protein